jgi:hypothetical protein
MRKKATIQSAGGTARAAKLTARERSEIARAGAKAKWSKAGVAIKTIPSAQYGSPDKPLRIGKTEIPCYVLDDERRVLVQRGLQTGIGMSTSGGVGGAHRMARFIASLEAKGVHTNDLSVRMSNPILFRLASRGAMAYGYEATILTEICDAVLEARKIGALPAAQDKYATQCEILVRGLAQVGIIALVDEATGYLPFKRQRDYSEILAKFISKELRPWVRRFPFEFYEKIFRLKGWDTSELTPNSPKPLEVGKITSDIYKRLAPGIRAELKRLTPRNEKGYLVHKLHQHLTDDIGNPKLEKHIAVTMALMDVAPDWQTFISHMNRVLPPFGKNYELPLDDKRPETPTLALAASSLEALPASG